MSYAFAVLAPLAVSMCLWLGLGWRAAMLLAVATGVSIVVRFRDVPSASRQRQGSSVSAAAVALLDLLVLADDRHLDRVLRVAVGAGVSRARRGDAAGHGRCRCRRICCRHADRSDRDERVGPFRGAAAIFLASLMTIGAGFALYWGGERPGCRRGRAERARARCGTALSADHRLRDRRRRSCSRCRQRALHDGGRCGGHLGARAAGGRGRRGRPALGPIGPSCPARSCVDLLRHGQGDAPKSGFLRRRALRDCLRIAGTEPATLPTIALECTFVRVEGNRRCRPAVILQPVSGPILAGLR